jgi:hypothetical protein
MSAVRQGDPVLTEEGRKIHQFLQKIPIQVRIQSLKTPIHLLIFINISEIEMI